MSRVAVNEGIGHWLLRAGRAALFPLSAVLLFGLGDALVGSDGGGLGAVVRLELAATPRRAALSAGSLGRLRLAVVTYLILLVVLAAMVAAGARYFGPRGYRVSGLSSTWPQVIRLVLVSGTLHLVGGVIVLAGVGGWWDSEMLWALAAALGWAKFLLLACGLVYVSGASIGSVVMPGWVHACPDPLRPDREAPAPRLTVVRRAMAVSGGGIRSASFALGTFQSLDGTDACVANVDHISSVSGGGYMVGAWMIGRSADGGHPRAWAVNERGESDSPEAIHLAENLNYLTDSSDGRPSILPSILVGILGNTVALVWFLWLVARPLGWFVASPSVSPAIGLEYSDPNRVLTFGPHQWGPPLAWLLVALVALSVWIGSARVLRNVDPIQPVLRRAHKGLRPVVFGSLAISATLAFLLAVAPLAMFWVPLYMPGGAGVLPRLVSVASILALVGVVVGILEGRFVVLLPRLGGAILVLGTLFVAGWIATVGAISYGEDSAAELRLWAVVAGVGWLAYLVVNPEWWSLAPFYRGRLRSVFAVVRQASGVGARFGDDQPRLAEMKGESIDPSFCGAVQISDERFPTHEGVPALDLTMSTAGFTMHLPTWTGRRPINPSCSLPQLAALMRDSESPRLSPMFAVGISGAAVAPSMGRQSFGATRALLAFANLRLGVWIPNPRFAAMVDLDSDPRPTFPRIRLSYLLKELFGVHDLDDLYVYATDGGHWENSAITQALRGRAVTELISVDGTGQPPTCMESIAAAISLVEAEYGHRIEIDIESTRAVDDQTRGGARAERAVTVGLIRYRGQEEDRIGLIWFTTLVVDDQHSTSLQAYAEIDTKFPGESTLNQSFGREMHEAYRKLGYENGCRLIEARHGLLRAVELAPSLGRFRMVAADSDNYAVTEVARLLRDDGEYGRLRAALAQP